MELPTNAPKMPIRPKQPVMPTRPNTAGEATAIDREDGRGENIPYRKRRKDDRLHLAQSAATKLGMSAPFWEMATATATERVAHALGELEKIYTEYNINDTERTDVLAAFVFGATTEKLTPRELYTTLFEDIHKVETQTDFSKSTPYGVPYVFFVMPHSYRVLYIATLILGECYGNFRFPQEEVARAYNRFYYPPIDSKTVSRFLYEVTETPKSNKAKRKRIILPKHLILVEQGKPGINGKGKPNIYRLNDQHWRADYLPRELGDFSFTWRLAQYEFIQEFNYFCAFK